jgi:hypothetical protein
MTKVDFYSFCTIPVFLSCSHGGADQHLAHATAFFWERRDRLYLITNWHVVTGRDNVTEDNLNKRTAGRPNKMHGQLKLKGSGFDRSKEEISAWDVNGNPLWFVHAAHGRKIDVIALPLQRDEQLAVFPINRPMRDGTGMPEDPLLINIGMDVFILGYPFPPKPPFLPVWKRGSIATEPDLANLTDYRILVDSATREGLSGAPVIRRSWGSHLTESGVSSTNWSQSKFLGVYSGRLHTRDSLDAQLGIVWPRSLIEEIIDGEERDIAD